jgi:hypothetical protein
MGNQEFRINGHIMKAEGVKDAVLMYAQAILAECLHPSEGVEGVRDVAVKYGLKVERQAPSVRIVKEFQELPKTDNDPGVTPYNRYGGERGFRAALHVADMAGSNNLPNGTLLDAVAKVDLADKRGEVIPCLDIPTDYCETVNNCDECPGG